MAKTFVLIFYGFVFLVLAYYCFPAMWKFQWFEFCDYDFKKEKKVTQIIQLNVVQWIHSTLNLWFLWKGMIYSRAKRQNSIMFPKYIGQMNWNRKPMVSVSNNRRRKSLLLSYICILFFRMQNEFEGIWLRLRVRTFRNPVFGSAEFQKYRFQILAIILQWRYHRRWG